MYVGKLVVTSWNIFFDKIEFCITIRDMLYDICSLEQAAPLAVIK